MSALAWWLAAVYLFGVLTALVGVALWDALSDPRYQTESETPDPKAGGITTKKDTTPWPPTNCCAPTISSAGPPPD